MKNYSYLVSFIVIAYNVENYLEKCVKSIENQTYNNYKIIIVNDGSTDSSQEIAERLALQNKKISVINQLNKGASSARNTGIENSTGEFICFIDGDDYLSKDFLEYFLSIYEKTKADLCISMNNFTTKNSNQVKTDKITTMSSELAVAELLYPRVRMGVWNKLWRREFILDNNFRFLEGQVTGEGLIFMTNAAQYANRVGVGQKKVYYYRLNNDQSATTVANYEKYGRGSLKALEIVEQNIDLQSTYVRNAMTYQKWATSTYALRQIIDSNTKNIYSDDYRNLINYIRVNSLKILKPQINVPLRMKIIAILRCINPVWITKLSLYFRDRHLKKGSK